MLGAPLITLSRATVGYQMATDAPPEFDPPHDGPCAFCAAPLPSPDEESAVRTLLLERTAAPFAGFRFFCRAHVTCALAASDADREALKKQLMVVGGLILDDFAEAP